MYSLDRRSSSPESNYYKRREREYSRRRSRSRSRSRNRSNDRGRSRRTRSRSRSRERTSRRSPDLYRDLINQDYQDDNRDRNYRNYDRSRDRERERRKEREPPRKEMSPSSYLEEISNDSHGSCFSDADNAYSTQVPNNKLIVRGLAQHITEADISNDLIQYGLKPVSIRLIRKKKTGASRGFAFVEFSTEEEATRWMEFKQGILMLQDQYRAVIQYSIPQNLYSGSAYDSYTYMPTDWYCGKCLVFNFKRRENCFKCYASREESVKGGEGCDEVSNILTKKIMLRNLDALTNEEGVLTIMQEVIPTLVSKISKILICRDPLTSTSRGVCYLSFDNLVDSMNTHNALKTLEPPLQIDSRDVLISYCVDSENRNIIKGQPAKPSNIGAVDTSSTSYGGANSYEYTAADVPRLAEYSASMYASNSVEHDHYLKYYTQYYISQIAKGQFSNLPTMSQMGGDTANSGAAVAQSAMQRKMKRFATNHTQPTTQTTVKTPNGTDGKIYPTPDISLYQYDETSGYYYDPMTGLYYDANSQYYYNNETNSYLYWDNDKSTYVQAASQQQNFAAVTQKTENQDLINTSDLKNDDKKDQKKDQKQDKVKVAKKIVKDMERWAKQLNQKKDMIVTQQIVKLEETQKLPTKSDNGYADVGFSILEKKEKTGGPTNQSGKFGIEIPVATTTVSKIPNKLVPSYGSDSENDQDDQSRMLNHPPVSEKDYVDFDKLTCLLCKRAFQSHDILIKHLKISNLHKENLQKFNMSRNSSDAGGSSTQSYRDRAKERRLKYGEDDSPPPNKSKERFQRELEKQQAAILVNTQTTSTAAPIGENNVGNRLLQKMGWSEGQGLGRSNQGRTNIIEAKSRASNAGLGSKTTAFAPGDDYKSYIKKMMKSRYDSVDIK